MDLELGGLHVPDPARREDLARLARSATSALGRSQDRNIRLDRDPDSARRNHPAVLIIVLTRFSSREPVTPLRLNTLCILQFRPPDAYVQRALAAMADMRLLEANHER